MDRVNVGMSIPPVIARSNIESILEELSPSCVILEITDPTHRRLHDSKEAHEQLAHTFLKLAHMMLPRICNGAEVSDEVSMVILNRTQFLYKYSIYIDRVNVHQMFD